MLTRIAVAAWDAVSLCSRLDSFWSITGTFLLCVCARPQSHKTGGGCLIWSMLKPRPEVGTSCLAARCCCISPASQCWLSIQPALGKVLLPRSLPLTAEARQWRGSREGYSSVFLWSTGKQGGSGKRSTLGGSGEVTEFGICHRLTDTLRTGELWVRIHDALQRVLVVVVTTAFPRTSAAPEDSF